MKNNKLIAEFMGCTNPFNEIHDATLYKVEQGTFELDELQYHTSWDWLMPVVEKCLEMHNNLIDGRDVIDTSYSSIAQALQVVSLKETYQAIVEFINQLNKNN